MNNINPTNMYFEISLVTPEMARKWLSTDTRNRKPSKRKIQMIEYDLKHNNFSLTHQPIAFDTDGELFDGRHRLTGIVNTGIPAVCTVAYNAPRNSKVDTGTKRTAKQANYMAGTIEKDSIEYDTLTYPLVTFIVSQSISEERAKWLTADNLHHLYTHLQEHIDPIVEIVRKSSGRCRSASVLYAMACAHADGIDKETLSKWHKIVETGDFYVQGDDYSTKVGRCVLSFRKFITEDVSTRGASAEDRMNIIKKAMSSIDHYANHEIIKGLKGRYVYHRIKVSEKDI